MITFDPNHTECPIKKLSIKNFWSELLTASIHSFWIYLDSVYLYVLFGVSFKRFEHTKVQQFFGDVRVFFSVCKFSRKVDIKF